MNRQFQEQLSVAEQAAHWVRVLNSDDPQQSAAFVEWIKASPLHVRELLLASWLDDELGAIDPERRIDVRELIERARSNVFPIGPRFSVPAPAPEPALKTQPRRSAWLGRIAASAALISILAIGVWYARSTGDNSYATNLGEQRVFELADGSVVFLNTQSRVQVRYSEATRDIYLRDGQALFQVRHDAARPFRVHAGSAVIQAIGTQFDVRLYSDKATVAVVEGIVQVSSSDGDDGAPASGSAPERAPTRIVAGEGATVETDGVIELTSKVDAEAVTAWRRQRLVFRDAPLSDIANEFNRYNLVPRLRVESPEVAAQRYNGSFNAHSPESLLNYLAQDEGLWFDRQGDEVVIRERVAQPQGSTRAPQ
jgi:transmembrane sensor